MASGFEGWIQIKSDAAYDSYDTDGAPQLLYVDSESLSFEKEILFHDSRVRNSHVDHVSAPILKAAKPQGDLVFQFRSDDCIKVLLAHFQCGTTETTSAPYRYAFYPRTNSLDFSYRGTLPNHPYGSIVARPYTVSVTKYLFKTKSYYEPNAFVFKGGVVDKLGFSLSANSDAKFRPHFFFREVDPVAVQVPPDDDYLSVLPPLAPPIYTDITGDYSTLPSFQSWSGRVVRNGVSIDLTSLSFESTHQTQEQTVVGRQAPESYQLSSYSLSGMMAFDLPDDALLEVGSMFSGGTFSLTATLYNSNSDQVIIEMPSCVRAPFNYNFEEGNRPIKGQIPFRAFENNGTHPLKITSITNYVAPEFFRFGDAKLGARSIPTSAWYNAGTLNRDFLNYTYYNRS